MPPRRSTRKVQKRFGQSLTPDGAEDAQTTHASGNGATAHGAQRSAPSLPLEMLAHIMNQLPEDKITDDIVLANPSPQDLSSDLLTRSRALIALSQVSVSFRQYFLPFARKRLYACTISGNGPWYKEVTEQLSMHSAMLVGNTHVASYVQIMTVALTRTRETTVIPAFAQALTCAPNLHTLELVHVNSQMTTILGSSFEKHKLPQIRRIILPSCAHNVLRACPEVREVVCIEEDGGKLVSAIAKACKHVELFHGLSSRLSDTLVKRLAKAAPNLRNIGFHPGYVGAAGVSRLGIFKRLSRYEFRSLNITEEEELISWDYISPEIIRQHIDAATAMLRALGSPSDKTIVRWSGTVRGVWEHSYRRNEKISWTIAETIKVN